ncbi:MAG TPA: serine/threonine-protein kinase [Candidatus Angelobacter sp.]|nr:serine/threonine-protein kinase [Candidatus Angelobacter sp.]
MLESISGGEIVRDTYTIVRHLGSGAFGDVYLARHRYMGLQALKVFVRQEGSDALEEAYLLARLGHPNIVRMFEANEFELNGQKLGYFSMEYVAGGTLLALLDAELSLDDRISLGKDLLVGLSFAHEQSPPIIHRDVCPTNILVEKSGGGHIAKISDFGLAKHVDKDSLLASSAGKYLYMAPESFLGIHSTATDVYSAGLVIFQLLTGSHPFRITLWPSSSPAEIAAMVRESRNRIVPDVTEACKSLSSAWNDFFRAALARDYEDRPATAGMLLQAYCSIARLPSPKPPHNEATAEAGELALQAKDLAQQTETLPEAIGLLERACEADPGVAAEYGALLSLWKRGIVL